MHVHSNTYTPTKKHVYIFIVGKDLLHTIELVNITLDHLWGNYLLIFFVSEIILLLIIIFLEYVIFDILCRGPRF